MGDDGLGTMVADELEKLAPYAIVDSCQTMDFSVLSRYRGASKIVVVDAVKAGDPPGTIAKYRIEPRETPLKSLPGQHALRIHDLFDFAREAGVLTCPLTIVGVEPRLCQPGEGLSDEVRGAIPGVIGVVLMELAASESGPNAPSQPCRPNRPLLSGAPDALVSASEDK